MQEKDRNISIAGDYAYIDCDCGKRVRLLRPYIYAFTFLGKCKECKTYWRLQNNILSNITNQNT